MLHLYDDAIANDLSRCINPDRANNIVKLSDEEALMGLVAQMQNDKIQFPPEKAVLRQNGLFMSACLCFCSYVTMFEILK